MTVKPQSYLIDWKQLTHRIKDSELFIIEDCLEPDTRLQAIKDTPRCEHGKIDEHLAQRQMHDSFGAKNRPHEYICIGAPELRFLLDVLEVEALTEEADET